MRILRRKFTYEAERPDYLPVFCHIDVLFDNQATKKGQIIDLALEYFGAGNGIRTRDFNLGKVALYH